MTFGRLEAFTQVNPVKGELVRGLPAFLCHIHSPLTNSQWFWGTFGILGDLFGSGGLQDILGWIHRFHYLALGLCAASPGIFSNLSVLYANVRLTIQISSIAITSCSVARYFLNLSVLQANIPLTIQISSIPITVSSTSPSTLIVPVSFTKYIYLFTSQDLTIPPHLGFSIISP